MRLGIPGAAIQGTTNLLGFFKVVAFQFDILDSEFMQNVEGAFSAWAP